MENILEKKHYRSIFFLVIGLVLTLAIVIRFLVLPQFDPSLSSNSPKFFAILLDGFVVSLIVTVIIGSFVFWLTPEIFKKSVMEVISPKDINPLLKKASTDTKSWIYKGACGRYTRATTLPTLAKAARNEGIGRDIRITVLNPQNSKLCEEYATYRRSLKSSNSGSEWTAEKVKEEVIATVILALKFKHEEPLLRIEIFLIDHFSAFRLDISDHYVVVTKEDKEASGLKADEGTYFYDSYKDDVRLSERQSINFRYTGLIPTLDEADEERIKRVILDAELLKENEVNSLNLTNILNSIKSPQDPYS